MFVHRRIIRPCISSFFPTVFKLLCAHNMIDVHVHCDTCTVQNGIDTVSIEQTCCHSSTVTDQSVPNYWVQVMYLNTGYVNSTHQQKYSTGTICSVNTSCQEDSGNSFVVCNQHRATWEYSPLPLTDNGASLGQLPDCLCFWLGLEVNNCSLIAS